MDSVFPVSDCEELRPTILLHVTVWFSGPFGPLVCYPLRDGHVPASQDDHQRIQPPQREDLLQGSQQIAASLGLQLPHPELEFLEAVGTGTGTRDIRSQRPLGARPGANTSSEEPGATSEVVPVFPVCRCGDRGSA